MANIPSFTKFQESDYYNEELSQALTRSLSNNGWTAPQQTTDQITASAPNMPNGTFWYNTDIDKLQVKEAGTVKTVTTT